MTGPGCSSEIESEMGISDEENSNIRAEELENSPQEQNDPNESASDSGSCQEDLFLTESDTEEESDVMSVYAD
jgi:hypothetical protein